MVQSVTKLLTFEEFSAWYPDTERRYELHDGIIIEMPKPTGKHSNVTGFLIEELILTIIQMGRRGVWTIPRESIVKSNRGNGYEPDIIVLDRNALAAEPHWERESIIENAQSVKLIVEVVSTNWRDDYFKKRADYEEMGIGEYWIVDYAALGGRNFLGDPKEPTLSVYQLVEGEYQISQFRGNEPIVSPTFPEFHRTAEQIFKTIYS
ncbi:Uma2 family endonuclease [Lusitaniella coriacea LEGE 07157]|uniref:Uma2 family endonuclease n=1 Tax=Lusitaniella coriacea LEGE 07157 TaxID=945747 RepID=A0A8J7B7J3_9CYAN|nr:Uma2 family endonuclease [Lusitaniella coriacea]MBE9115429.1 Uma2 family endonuclease [Lusitaniella coriacea LEGE 07157]